MGERMSKKRGLRGGPSDGRRNLHMSDILLRPIIAMQIAVHQLREREDGQTTTEYAILLGFLAIAIIIALFFLRNVLRSLFSSAASCVSRDQARAHRQGYRPKRPASAGRLAFPQICTLVRGFRWY